MRSGRFVVTNHAFITMFILVDFSVLCDDYHHVDPQFSGCSFTGSAGQAIVSRSNAYLVTDSRYWLQAEDELDDNWSLIRAGLPDGPKDWAQFLIVSISYRRFSLIAI